MPDKKTLEKFERLLCERGDAVDNAVYRLVLDLLGEDENSLPWNMEIIGNVADAVEGALKRLGRPMCRPYNESGDDGEDTPCFMTGDCACAVCPMREAKADG